MSEETRPTGHITASSLDRIAFCPGSWLLEQKVPATDEDVGLEAQSGIRIHAALAGEIEEEILTPEERETYDACVALTKELVPGTHKGNYAAEQRLYLREGAKVIFSGRFDAAWTAIDLTLIIDYKTGRGSVPPADRNWQMRSLAVLWDANHIEDHGKPIEVAIIRPLGSPQVTRCLYTPEDLQKSHGLLLDMLKLAYDPKAPRRASEEACRYCRAKAICPEAQQSVYRASSPALVGPALELMSALQLCSLLEACETAKHVIPAIKAEARRRIEAGEKFGWHLKPGVERERICDLELLHDRCARIGIANREFVAACGMAKNDLKDLVRENTGQKGMGLDLTIKQLLDGIVDVKVTEPSLERDKERDEEHGTNQL